MATDSTLRGRTALVTGAGRGIGRALALELAAAGAVPVLVARSEDELAETARLVKEQGGAPVTLRTDLGEQGAGTELARRVSEETGRVDILINNAATVQPLGPSAAMDIGRWAAALTLNVTAPAELSFALVPGMLAGGWGRVVNVSSSVASHPGFMVGGNAYATTKAALEAHTLNLATELAGTGVTANVFRPGSVDTAMQTVVRERGAGQVGTELHEHFTRSYAEGLLITPEQSAHSLAARLGGDDTGEIWDVSDPL